MGGEVGKGKLIETQKEGTKEEDISDGPPAVSTWMDVEKRCEKKAVSTTQGAHLAIYPHTIQQRVSPVGK